MKFTSGQTILWTCLTYTLVGWSDVMRQPRAHSFLISNISCKIWPTQSFEKPTIYFSYLAHFQSVLCQYKIVDFCFRGIWVWNIENRQETTLKLVKPNFEGCYGRRRVLLYNIQALLYFIVQYTYVHTKFCPNNERIPSSSHYMLWSNLLNFFTFHKKTFL